MRQETTKGETLGLRSQRRASALPGALWSPVCRLRPSIGPPAAPNLRVRATFRGGDDSEIGSLSGRRVLLESLSPLPSPSTFTQCRVSFLVAASNLDAINRSDVLRPIACPSETSPQPYLIVPAILLNLYQASTCLLGTRSPFITRS